MDTPGLKSLAIVMCLSGSVAAQSLQYGGIREVGSLKRGKEYSIRWYGGSTDQRINITLQNSAGERVQSWTDLVNDGEHTLKLNPRLKPQKGYVLDITVADEENGVISSSDIRIRRRIPLAVTLSTVVVVPVAIILFARDNSTQELPEVPALPQ